MQLDLSMDPIGFYRILLDFIGAKDSLGVRSVKESVSRDYSSVGF